MPKKAHGRQAKQRSRSRRATSPMQTPQAVYKEDGVSAAPIPAAAATAPAARPATAAPRAATRPGAARRAPTLTINYGYLRRDLVSLGILGPAMIVLLIVAYLIFHGA
jgi:hypothetical protein